MHSTTAATNAILRSAGLDSRDHRERPMSNDKTAEEDSVRALNAQMHAEELRGAEGLPFYREVLDQSLRFRRASGDVVTRDEYLIDLANPANRRDEIEAVGPIDCTVYENTAV